MTSSSSEEADSSMMSPQASGAAEGGSEKKKKKKKKKIKEEPTTPKQEPRSPTEAGDAVLSDNVSYLTFLDAWKLADQMKSVIHVHFCIKSMQIDGK